MSECDELKPWLYALIIVPSIFNVMSLSTTHWLMRTAVRVGLGPKAKRALLAYARSKPELQRLSCNLLRQLSRTEFPNVKADEFSTYISLLFM
uniref:Uncharacterized protein n=1 Tax=Ditylenchus dipsaci TaxID=166011 RepID=A0A915ETT7_9BILA